MSTRAQPAWIAEKPGQAARLTNAPARPPLQPGEVRIRGHFAAVNFKDALALTGRADIVRRFPLIVGQDVSGTVIESRHPDHEPGQRVVMTGCGLGETRDGTFTPEIIAPGDCTRELPADWSLEMAAAVGTAGFTAAYALLKLQQVGQTPMDGPLLVTGASGGVGSHALTLLDREGFEVIALSRKKHHHADLLALGARRVMDKLPDRGKLTTKPLLSPHCAGAIDTLGGDTLAWLLASTQAQGNVVCLGLAESARLHTTVLPFILRGINVLGLTASHAPLAWRKRVWDFLFTRLNARNYRIPYRVMPLRDARKAADFLMTGDNFGRVLLDLRSASQESTRRAEK